MGMLMRNRKCYTGKVRDRSQYSTTEQVTGEYWIDGKPIYRKVFVDTVPTTAGTSTRISIGASVDKAINIGGFFLNNENKVSYPIGYIGATNTPLSYVMATVRTDGDTTAPNTIQYASSYNNGTIYFIIEYTKTTD